jgi:hypothetical protein
MVLWKCCLCFSTAAVSTVTEVQYAPLRSHSGSIRSKYGSVFTVKAEFSIFLMVLNSHNMVLYCQKMVRHLSRRKYRRIIYSATCILKPRRDLDDYNVRDVHDVLKDCDVRDAHVRVDGCDIRTIHDVHGVSDGCDILDVNDVNINIKRPCVPFSCDYTVIYVKSLNCPDRLGCPLSSWFSWWQCSLWLY